MPPTRRRSRRRTAQPHSARPGTWSGSTQHRRSISRLARSFMARPRPAASPAERRLKRRGLGRARGTNEHSLAAANSAQEIVVRCLAHHSKDLATAALMQQFSEVSIGRSDLLNPADVHRKFVVVKSGDLILGHQDFLPSRSRTISNPKSFRELRRADFPVTGYLTLPSSAIALPMSIPSGSDSTVHARRNINTLIGVPEPIVINQLDSYVHKGSIS